MAVSRVSYLGDGVTTRFSLSFPYLAKDHVKVFVNTQGQARLLAWDFASDSEIEFFSAPVADAVVEIRRVTDRTNRLVDFENGSVLTEEELDLAHKQHFYTAQELQEEFAQLLGDGLQRFASSDGVFTGDVQQAIDAVVAEVLASQLYVDLQSRINDIDLNAQGIIDVAADLSDEVVQRQTLYNQLSSQISGLAAGIAATTFVQPDEPVPGVNGVPDPIPEGARWYDEDDDYHPYLWDNTGMVWLDLLDPQIGQNAANIASLQAALTTAEGDITGLQSSVSTIDATVTALNGEVASQGADITTLQGSVNDPATGNTALGTAINGLTNRVTLAEDELSSQSTLTASLSATIFDPTSGLPALSTAVTGLDASVTQNTDGLALLTTDVTQLENAVFDPATGLSATSSGLSALDARVTTAEGSISSQSAQLLALSASLSTVEGDIAGNAQAINGIDARVTSAEGDITAQASTLTQLQTSINGNTTSIQQQASTINGLEGQYTVKIDNNGYVTGFGLASTTVNGTPTSEFIVRADRFAVGAAGVSDQVPFVVQNGRVYIDSAFIRSLSADIITTGTMSADRISIDGSVLDTDGSGRLTINGIPFSLVTGSDRPEAEATRGVIDTHIAQTDGQVNNSSATSWIDAESLTFTLTRTTEVLLEFTAMFRRVGSSSTTFADVRIQKNGAEIGGLSAAPIFIGGTTFTPFTWRTREVLPAGTYTYRIQFKAPQFGITIGAFSRVITATETR